MGELRPPVLAAILLETIERESFGLVLNPSITLYDICIVLSP